MPRSLLLLVGSAPGTLANPAPRPCARTGTCAALGVCSGACTDAQAHADLETAPQPNRPPRRVARLADGPIVPPRQYDLMRAAVWAPAPMPATRPGADDHKRYASRGHGC